jgi:hypothetical protein
VIRSLGFEKAQRHLFCTRVGKLNHNIFLRKDGLLKGHQFIASVTHSSFEQFATDGVPCHHSPVSGCLSPRGVVENYTWSEGPDDSELRKLLILFFSCFGRAEDLVNSLSGRYVSAQFAETIANIAENGDDDAPMVERGGVPRYETVGGLMPIAEVGTKIGRQLEKTVFDLGFVAVKGDPLTLIRERLPGVFDCIRVLFDTFGTIFSIQIFSWVKELWAADRRLRGEFHPFNSVFLQSGSAPVLLSAITATPELFAPLAQSIESTIAQFAAVNSVREYVETIRPEYSLIRERFLRFR